MIRFRAILGAAALAATALAATAADNLRVVLKGYDPVAYFTDGKPVKGDPKYAYDWDDGRYHFANAKHRDMFAGNPDKYAPQFGGYCTGSMSRGVRNEGDPEGWTIKEGKLYVFGDKKWKPIAEADPQFIPSRLDNATRNWQERKRGS
jgi:YHS domain-containing protein